MGNYAYPVKYLISKITNCSIIESTKITDKTIEIGNKYSPNFVCTPFKYTLGTMIENLEIGANVLIQFGGGCRYGYYSELQEKILRNLGYKFTFISLVSKGKTDYKLIYKKIKKIEPKLNVFKSLYYLLITIKMVKYMDKIDDFIRMNISFERIKNSYFNLNNKMLEDFIKSKSLIGLFIKYLKYKIKFKKIKTNKTKHYRVALIGELYTLMEPFANHNIEQILAKYPIKIKRYTNVYYLLFQKKNKSKKYLKYANEYIKYKLGADAHDNIGRTKYLCKHKYDGIIHIKSSFCTPEIGAMPIINKICNEYNVPVMFLTFDSSTSNVGVETRIEAFYDMMEMKK